jgi:allantoate deiminase
MVTDRVSGGERAVARCDTLGVAPFSDSAAGLYRGYLTPAHRHAVDQVAQWMAEAGMSARLDPAANLVGRYEGSANGPALVIGSHIDSVRDAGRYDGPLGVLLGIELVDALARGGERLPFPIEIIAFGDEEGSRFPSPMLTSQAVAGTLAADLAQVRDADGCDLATALAGFAAPISSDLPEQPLDIAHFHTARRAPGSVLAYLEAHIEQGPVLEAEGLALGTVTGIASQCRYQVAVIGTAGHAGTTSMPLRRDALAGAAEMLMAIEQVAQSDGGDLVATVGKLAVAPGAANVIPGSVTFTIDIRSGDAGRRDRAAAVILARIEAIAAARGLQHTAARIHDLPGSPCDPRLIALMDAALQAGGHPPRQLVSGAGHDAMTMAALCPTAMLFIRCRGGVSHNPAEFVTVADSAAALDVMLRFVRMVADEFTR